tara:strand:+ start:581 stop:691 length:111 start_codon:yes stop_codon:yes gene_type:complete
MMQEHPAVIDGLDIDNTGKVLEAWQRPTYEEVYKAA